jgi:hypothetical protein
MAFTGNFMCTSFKTELLYGAHDFDAASGDTFKIALYTSSATLMRQRLRIRLLTKLVVLTTWQVAGL